MRSQSISCLVFALSLTACKGKEPAPAPAPSPPPPAGSAAVAPAAGSAATPAPAPAGSAATPAKPALAELQAASVKAIAEALNAHDAKKYAAQFAEHGVKKSGGSPDLTGRDAIAAGMQTVIDAFPDFKIAFGRTWTKGNVVVSTWAWTGTNTGSFAGGKPTGRPAGVEGASVATYGDDGLITELHLYVDDATLMSQLDPKADKASFRAPPALPTAIVAVTSTGSPDEQKNLDTFKGLYVALDEKKEPDAMAYFTEDSTLEDFSSPGSGKGMKAAKDMYASYVTAFPDFKQLPLANQWAIGDFVISEGILAGTHKGAMGPIKASGKPVSVHFIDIIEAKGGKIAHLQTWVNMVELLAEIGAIKAPAPPAPATPAKK